MRSFLGLQICLDPYSFVISVLLLFEICGCLSVSGI
jgi:hypothetical protein